MIRQNNEITNGIQELSQQDLDQVSGGFLFLIVAAAVALGGCLADCGHPPVEHP